MVYAWIENNIMLISYEKPHGVIYRTFPTWGHAQEYMEKWAAQ